MKKWALFLAIIVCGFAFSHRALALDPKLTIVSPSPGEVIASDTVNAIIDTDIGLAASVDASGYVVQLWLDSNPENPSNAITVNQRGYIFQNVPAGLHTLSVAISDRSTAGIIVPVSRSSVDFEVSPPFNIPLVGQVSWYSLFRDGVIFSFPIVGLALLLFWMHIIIRRR